LKIAIEDKLRKETERIGDEEKLGREIRRDVTEEE
jgi:hypothetical protein